jgi:uncharacterized protein with GYD domain
METFIMQTRLSTDAVRSPRLLEEHERRAMNRVRAQCPEVKWIASYAVLGPCDYVDVFEAPSVEVATKVATIIRTFGHAITEVWAATPWERFKEIVRELPAEADWRTPATKEELRELTHSRRS